MFDTIIHALLASSYVRRLRMRGRRGMAIEHALVALLIAFATFQVLFVVSVSATKV